MKNGLNEAFFKNGEWVKQYSNTKATDVNPDFADKGELHPFRFTYALSRGPLQDAAGANAMWNITNVTRSNRRYHYLDTYFANAEGEDKTVYGGSSWVKASANDPEVQAGYQAYIEEADPKKNHPSWHANDYSDKEQVAKAIAAYLTSKELDVEMDDEDFIDFMVWHRGLAVPAVRNIDDADVRKGKELFTQIGCAYCHRPSWKTGDDTFYDPNGFLPRETTVFPGIRTRQSGLILTWYSINFTWKTISVPDGAVLLLFGDADCIRCVQALLLPTACTTTVHETSSKQSCGTETQRVMPA